MLASAEGRTQMSIVNQQLELHFGDNYASVDKQARKYVNSLLSRPWWGANREALIGNEGGPQGMRLNAILSIIEHEDDIETGLRAYGSSLRLEYGSDKQTTIPLDEGIEISPTGEGEPRADSLESHSPDGLGDIILPLTDTEMDFFTTFASVKDIQETSSLLGISYSEGRKVYKRVWARGKRRLQGQ